MEDFDLAGRRVVVGGSSSGIGFAIASAFAVEGCKVHLIGRDAERLEEARAKIQKNAPAEICTHALDVSDCSAFSQMLRGLPDIDILINNGAAAPAGSIELLDDEVWRKAWDSKVFAYINAIRTVLPRMYDRKSGVIINVIGGGVLNKYDYVCGTSGNAALIALTNAVGSRSTDHGVRVIGVNPTSTKTDTFMVLARERAKIKLGAEERVSELFNNLPFGRLCEPNEVAQLVVFLASSRASYLSGTCINIDGGASHR